MAKKSGTKYRKTVTIGHGIDGKPIRKDFYGATKGELNEKIEEYKYNLRAGIAQDVTTQIGFEKWSDIWYESYKRGQIEMSTAACIESMLRIFCDYFGDTDLRYIKQADIMRFFQSRGDATTGYLRKMYNNLYQIFDKAVANDLIVKNPMEGLKKPVGKKEDVEKKAYTYEEYRKVVDFAKTHPDGLGPFIMLKTGVRLSELLGLKGSDIDFETGLIHIRRTSTNQGLKEKGKTKNAVRSIPIDDECKAYLNSHIACHGNHYLFTSNGKPRKPGCYRETAFKRFQSDLLETYPELPKMTPHEYRHSFGTLLYQSGTELLTLSRIMGHSNTMITQKTYVHDTINDVIKNVRFPSESLREKESCVKLRDSVE